MTVVHDVDEMRVGDLVLSVSPALEGTSLAIVVERDASLVLKVPATISMERAEAFVASKRPWIYRKLAEKDALVGPTIVKQFVDGEGFAYLGRSHRLQIVDSASAVRLEHGRFTAPPSATTDGERLMREWYAGAGRQWLRRRIKPWAARLGAGEVAVEVRDLGYRWGSAKPTSGEQRINIHWATLQLPPTLIDYVLVHELAHLREANHTPEFWAIVSRLMPGYESQKVSLASIGKSVWLGEK